MCCGTRCVHTLSVLCYQKDIKGEFLNAVSAELFIHLSFITLYNDSEMKGKMRGGEIEEESECGRSGGLWSWHSWRRLLAGISRGQWRFFPSSRFLVHPESAAKPQPLPITEVTLVSRPQLLSSTDNEMSSHTA